MPGGRLSGMPEVCVSRSRRVIGRGGFLSVTESSDRVATIIRPTNSGRCFSTGSSIASFPSSASIMTAIAVIGLVIEAMRKSVSGRIGRS